MSDNILSLNNVNTFYGESQILRDIKMEIPKCSITALMGRNGVGKNNLTQNHHGNPGLQGWIDKT